MAKVRYMIDYVFDEARFKRGEYPYVPCGVWAMSETQFEVGYLTEFEERAAEVDAFLTSLVEQGIDPVKVEGFLEYWREQRPTGSGSFSEITDTAASGSLPECVHGLLTKIIDSAQK